MKRWSLLIPPFSILLLTLLTLWIGSAGAEGFRAFFVSPVSNPLLLGKMLNRSFLLMLPGLGILLAFGSGVYNLGGEGQIYLGGMISLMVMQWLPDLPAAPAWLIAWSAGILGGMLPAALAALLKEKAEVHELISTYLLALGITHMVDGLITGPFSDSDSYLMTTRPIAEAYRLQPWMPPSKLNGSILLILFILLLVYIFLYHRKEGVYWRLSGNHYALTRYAGASPQKIQRRALLLSGGLHGLAGALLISGQYFRALQGFSGGLGWDGMAVALMAELHPLGLIPAGFFFAWLQTGSENAQLQGFLGVNLKGFILAFTFFLVTSRVILLQRRRRRHAL